MTVHPCRRCDTPAVPPAQPAFASENQKKDLTKDGDLPILD